MEWYEYDEKDRINNIFAKYTISDFYNWWSKNRNYVMEVRIKDFMLIKELWSRFRYPYSSSGIYIKNENELKNIISSIRDRATCWFGINPRKINYNNYGNKMFGGRDENVLELSSGAVSFFLSE